MKKSACDPKKTQSGKSFRHVQSVLMNAAHFITVKRPLVVFGLPGCAVFTAGVILTVREFFIAAQTGNTEFYAMLISGLILIFGVMLICAALILYALSYLREVYFRRYGYE
ncbi:MAG: hypothetical protein Q4Q53_08495 [Methanocorpusculum sp.]|nr:hypothetical protein [Methanocorpusculum sp.]